LSRGGRRTRRCWSGRGYRRMLSGGRDRSHGSLADGGLRRVQSCNRCSRRCKGGMALRGPHASHHERQKNRHGNWNQTRTDEAGTGEFCHLSYPIEKHGITLYIGGVLFALYRIVLCPFAIQSADRDPRSSAQEHRVTAPSKMGALIRFERSDDHPWQRSSLPRRASANYRMR
jgi:hypothetical protein